MESNYGNIEGGELPKFTGEVEGYCLSRFEKNEEGVLEIQFSKPLEGRDPITLRGWINPADPEKVKVFDEESKEEAVAREEYQISATIKSIVRNYCTDETYAEKMKSVNSYETLIDAAISLLPENFADIPGKLLVGYNKKGYLAFPYNARVFRNKGYLGFYTTDMKGNLMYLPNYLSENKPQQVTQEALASSTKW